MDEILKFVYTLIIFFSLFFAANNVDANIMNCQSTFDCPRDMCSHIRDVICIFKKCKCAGGRYMPQVP
ncbi:putative Late nodulin [Medicago truncatula]|uniref:Nodule Cysteine-Rich (NCR) secreted peptide n=1 Tax=Medicago truncatula TaxID=3880 RepID=A7KHD3_MEDTR|nr:nodule-specific cysteine-rich peptide 286 [Medicago truncatula]AES98482.1 Nodule Cysteine-Rich (NCR) secreted peptide [Medicago truncatula]RHN56401.1 putative Late nodulin [Medicago truncatula]